MLRLHINKLSEGSDMGWVATDRDLTPSSTRTSQVQDQVITNSASVPRDRIVVYRAESYNAAECIGDSLGLSMGMNLTMLCSAPSEGTSECPRSTRFKSSSIRPRRVITKSPVPWPPRRPWRN